MVYGSEQTGVQAENIAGDHESENLPFAVGHEPVTECHPMREDERRAGHVTFAHDVGIRLEAFLVEAQGIENADVLVREWHEMRELQKNASSTDFTNESYLRNCLIYLGVGSISITYLVEGH
jgi:hypothetical protein